MKTKFLAWLLLASALFSFPAAAAPTVEPALVPVLKRSFFHGREYFVLRSGRAKLIVQADQADLSPAFLYLLFDAEDNRQSRGKEHAFNFAEGQGFVRSALEVTLGGFPFTAVGHQTTTRWLVVDGIPQVEAVWWAGGLRVTERIAGLAGSGVFLRHIEVASVNLGGIESVKLSLNTPQTNCVVRDAAMMEENPKVRFGLSVVGTAPSRCIPESGTLEIGPLIIAPGQTVSVDTLLHVNIPSDQPWAPIDLPAALARTRLFWAGSSSVSTADKTVQEIFDKSRFGLPGMVADNGVMDAGMFEYGAQWVRDTSNTLLGMIHAGQFELARQGFDHVIKNMVNAEGNAMIAGAFANPDLEQFDQMGELMHALKAYRDWTGDDSLIRTYRERLVAMVERPLKPEFREACGMVHNRREFWERTLDDAFELAYQTYVILGLRDAAALAEPLGVPDRAARWQAEADRIQQAMLSHPKFRLVEAGRLIKRRAVNGDWVKTIRFPAAAADVPLKTEQTNLSEPDATMALPVAFGLVDAKSAMARKTLD